MKDIQKKIIIVIVTAVVVSAVAVGLIGSIGVSVILLNFSAHEEGVVVDLATRNVLIGGMLLALAIIVVIFIFVAIIAAQRMVKPIQELNEVAKQVAYRDSMTGVKNKTAYMEAVKSLENRMRIGVPEFGLVVLDVNELKNMNDTYGHDVGDSLIISASKMICNTFKRSPVFRIGGDEFVVILENEDYKNYQQLLELFDQTMNEKNASALDPRELVYVAKGVAIFDHERDIFFDHVFRRADEAMYANKADMKSKA